jgi:glutamine synthetase adenylyltransferase
MPEEYEVHGPHDHALEHAAAHGGDPLASRIAVTTAILATVGALFSYEGGSTEGLALFYKNEAAIKKTEAANQWAYYQAKGEKQNLAELGASLRGTDAAAHAHFVADIDKYKQQKEEIRAKAEALEKDVDKANADSETQLHRHHRWAQATTLVQIAISLAAITLLTRKKWLQGLAYGVAGAGVVVGVVAWFGV